VRLGLGLPVAPRTFTVSEVAAGLRELLEEEIGRIFVVGEIAEVHRARSGHCYFTLKDEGARLRAVLFRAAAVRLPFDPEEGLEVLVEGALSLYAPRGDLQLVVRALEPRGRGALQLAFEQLRARLEAEGLFDPAAKRPLPRFPRRVGVVTSREGAALRDVIQVSGERFPGIPLLLAPTRVQGAGAEEELAAALAALGGVSDVDVILLVRGGGSLEDLLPFNTERLARAVRACRVPVVAGVGHEVDVTIADLAADLRAPTPSAAAAAALPDRRALAVQLERDLARLRVACGARLRDARRRLSREVQALRAQTPRARLAAQCARLAAGLRALAYAAAAAGERARARFAAAAAQLDVLSPLAVLGRGYAIARREDGGVVRRASDVAAGARLRVRVAQAELTARVEEVRALDAGGGRDDAA
jgi:exodeoxyribonuclease VII large subunit